MVSEINNVKSNINKLNQNYILQSNTYLLLVVLGSQFCKIEAIVLFCSVVNAFVYNNAHLFLTHFQHKDELNFSLGPPL